MAHIYRTTMSPGKQDLIRDWLPSRTWYQGAAPEPVTVGGFRIDDPAGEVGIEFLLMLDDAEAGVGQSVLYSVPLTYRGAPLPGADAALLGTSEHGVLGTRWIYDAAADPVAITAIGELVAGRVQAQHRTRSDAADPAVRVSTTPLPEVQAAEPARDDSTGTDVAIGTSILRFHRMPRPADSGAAARPTGSVSVPYQLGGHAHMPVELVTVSAAQLPG